MGGVSGNGWPRPRMDRTAGSMVDACGRGRTSSERTSSRSRDRTVYVSPGSGSAVEADKLVPIAVAILDGLDALSHATQMEVDTLRLHSSLVSARREPDLVAVRGLDLHRRVRSGQ